MKLKTVLLSTSIALSPLAALAAPEPVKPPTTASAPIPVDPVQATLNTFQQDFSTFQNSAEEDAIAGNPKYLSLARDMKLHAQNWFKAMQDRSISFVKDNASLKDSLAAERANYTKLKLELDRQKADFDLYKETHLGAGDGTWATPTGRKH